jgi:uncharacterized membrane protein YgaE (UPF0421/DUF939 family)
MHIGRFRLGMRTFKSAFSVFLCILFFHVFQRGTPMIAALSAVFSLRQDLPSTVSFGKSRIIGNTLGGFLAVIYFFLLERFHNDFMVELIVLPILVLIAIVVSDGIGNNAGIIASIAALLLITLSIPQGESVLYTIQRVFDTFIGTFIAVGINFIIRPPEDEKKEELAENLAVLQEKEAKLKEELGEVKRQISERNRK